MIKVEMPEQLKPIRGGPVTVGNVYTNAHTKYFRLIVAIVPKAGNRPWNDVVCLHLNIFGDIIGCSNQPYDYVSNHMDLVGKCNLNMPALKVEWVRHEGSEPSGKDAGGSKKSRQKRT
jgi:hypothetical protein